MGIAEPPLLERATFVSGERLADRADQLAELQPDTGLLFALHHFPEIGDWLQLLRRLAIPVDQAVQIAALAERKGTSLQVELLDSGIVTDDAFYRALAEELGLGFVTKIDPDRLIMTDRLALSFLRKPSWHIPLKLEELDGSTGYLIAPSGLGPGRLRRLTEQYPRIVSRLRIARPGLVRAAVFERSSPLLAQHAKTDLFDRFPSFSARIVANAWQGSVWGAALVAVPAAIWVAPMQAWTALHCFLSVFFLGCVALRLAAWGTPAPYLPILVSPVPAADLPVYSVLVALYDEAEIVPELVAALRQIVWPKSKLDIKLVCEEDDAATLGALGAVPLPGNFEIVRVPCVGPRTKPKALAFALPLASGEFVAIYDAEDRPDPMQLLEAWQKFRSAGPRVGCIQAPLEVPFRQREMVPLMFAFEYATLFRGLLPWLSSRHLLLPLGGTSNHFRGLM